MKATALLERQHRKVEGLIAALENGKEPATLLGELADHLAAHMTIEQDIFYPTIREAQPSVVEDCFEEHAILEVALRRLLKTPPHDAQFAARVVVLKELVHRHVDTEEVELFSKVDQAIGQDELDVLGEHLEVAFEAALQEGFYALMPLTSARTSADEARERPHR